MFYSYKLAMEKLSQGEKDRLLSLFLSKEDVTSTIDWATATSAFGSASVDSMRVSTRNALKKIQVADQTSASEAYVPSGVNPDTPVKNKGGRKRKVVDDDDDENDNGGEGGSVAATPASKKRASASKKVKVSHSDEDDDATAAGIGEDVLVTPTPKRRRAAAKKPRTAKIEEENENEAMVDEMVRVAEGEGEEGGAVKRETGVAVRDLSFT